MKTLFTAILATLCIALGTPYLFLPQNMLLLEVIVIGIPSFFLSLQPNNARVEGKFISYVLSRSVPGAVLMVICVMAMYLTFGYELTAPVDSDWRQYSVAMCTMALTFSGLVMLFRVCQPFNPFRLILFLCMFAVGIGAFLIPFVASLLVAGWENLVWDYSKILILVVVVESAFPLSNFFIKVMQILMPSVGNSQKKNPPKPKKQG
jgi:cation-transporting ATPase E